MTVKTCFCWSWLVVTEVEVGTELKVEDLDILDRFSSIPTLAQLVERRTVVGLNPTVILRSLVRIRQVG